MKTWKPIKSIIYLTLATISFFIYLNSYCYNFINDDFIFKYFIVRIVLIFWLFYYLMGFTFTILIHPIVLLVKILKKKYRKDEIKLYIVLFMWSIIIAIAYIYFIFGKGFIITV
ncbi:MAG: hypothetical protein FWD47_08085 [Treponema sp.]|nr:hypothetical protein [Treponema sp.]